MLHRASVHGTGRRAAADWRPPTYRWCR